MSFPILYDRNFMKRQYVTDVILPNYDKIQKMKKSSNNVEEPTEKQEPKIEELKIEESTESKTPLGKMKATKSHEEIMELIKKLPHDHKPQEEPIEQTDEKKEFKPDFENLLTGELISLCTEVTKRLEWYNDIDFLGKKGIGEKRELKKKVVKFETQTIISYANKYNKLYKLLEHLEYPKNMLSSTKERSYKTIFEEFEKEDNFMMKIVLVDELKMICSSWLPKPEVYLRRKRVSPVIAGKAKSSADKGGE